MIDTAKYKSILDQGLLLDHYIILLDIREGKEVPNYGRVQGFLNLLYKKGYIEDGVLAQKAYDLLDITEVPAEPVVVQQKPAASKLMGKDDVDEFVTWVINLHKRLQNKLVEKTGKKQIRDKIDGVPHQFLPNPTDLGNQLLKTITIYKLNDLPKIEKCLLKYIDEKAKTNRWFPILYYYILKDKASKMVTDMDTLDEEEAEGDSTINI
jgi:hypothetical protein